MPRCLTAWHGTRDLSIEALSVRQALMRDGRAQHGPGLYLTTDLADALSFALPIGVVWLVRLWLDTQDELAEVRVVPLGAGITHYVLGETARFDVVARFSVHQSPARKLGQDERRKALLHPEKYGLQLNLFELRQAQ